MDPLGASWQLKDAIRYTAHGAADPLGVEARLRPANVLQDMSQSQNSLLEGFIGSIWSAYERATGM